MTCLRSWGVIGPMRLLGASTKARSTGHDGPEYALQDKIRRYCRIAHRLNCGF